MSFCTTEGCNFVLFLKMVWILGNENASKCMCVKRYTTRENYLFVCCVFGVFVVVLLLLFLASYYLLSLIVTDIPMIPSHLSQ